MSRRPIAWRARAIWALLFVGLALGSLPHADASTPPTLDECTDAPGSGSFQFAGPQTIHVGRDAEFGAVLGRWVTISISPGWRCVRTRRELANRPVPIGIQTASINGPSLGLLNLQGQTVYNVYPVGGRDTGLGYIVRYRARIDGRSTEWFPLTTDGYFEYQGTRPPISVTRDLNETYTISVESQVHFVKVSSNLGTGTYGAELQLMEHVPYQRLDGVGRVIGPGKRPVIAAGNLTLVGAGTCITPDVQVALPAVEASLFTNRQRGPVTDFELRFNDCPAGLARISYFFSPTTNIISGTPGVVALDSTATAGGVGVQLLDEQDTPIVFNELYILDAYDPAQQRSYSVPLKAAIYQTDSPVTPGQLSTSVSFTLFYQ